MTSNKATLPEQSQPFRLGDWIVEPSLNLLRQEGREVILEPRLMSLLTYLAGCAGRAATKEEILGAVWHGVAATDESLSQAIFKLRRTLGDDSERPAYIETIRKKGYRLVAAVTPVSAGRKRPGKRLGAAIGAALAILLLLWLIRLPPSPPLQETLEGRPLTSRPGRERDPSISTDGRYIVYAVEDDTANGQVFLHGIGKGTQDRQLTARGDNSAPAFFTDGERVAFLRRSESNCTVIMMTLVDAAERIVGDCNGNGYGDTAVSPDGRSIAFNARDSDGSPRAIYVLDIESGRRTVVTTPPAGVWGDYDPVFSADGRSLYFARSVSEGMQDIYPTNPGAGRETRLTHDNRNVFGIALADDKIIFGSNRSGRYALWSMPVDSGPLARLPIDSSGIVNPSVAAGGSRIVYEVIDRAVSLESVATDGRNESEVLLSFNADILHPDISPAGGRIAFSSNRSGHYEIWDANPAGGDLRQLTRFGSGFTAHPKFSPDGSQIALDARPVGNAQVFVMLRDGSGLRELTSAGENAYAPTWSANGRSVVYASDAAGALQLRELDIDTGQSRQLTSEGGLYGYLAPDGYLYHVRPGVAGIWRTQDRQAAPEMVLQDFEPLDWGNWGVTVDGVFYYDRQSASLRRFDPVSGEQSKLADVAGNLPAADPAVAFDDVGQRAIVGIRRRLDSDLELVELATAPR